MKTKTIFLLCLIIGIGFTKLAAQKNEDKSWVTKDYDMPYGYWAADVWCDGVWIDYIEGSGTAHIIDHFKNGEWQWGIAMIKGEGTSWRTGEKFTYSEQDKWYTPRPGMWTCHTNLKGDKGTMYNISLDLSYNGYVVKNATCTGNSK